MFKVDFMVDDKHLAKMHRALDGLAIFNLEVRVVHNVATKQGKAVSAGGPATGPEALWAYIESVAPADTIQRSAVMAAADGYGVPRSSVGAAFTSAIKGGLLRKTKKRGTLKVNIKKVK